MTDIDHYRKAVESLKAFVATEEYTTAEAQYTSGREAYEAYTDLRQQKSAVQGEIARLEKLAEELKPWGEFDGNAREALAQQGVVLRYYVAQSSAYDAHAAEWGADLTIVEIGRDASSVYFVVVTTPGAEVIIDAQEIKAPTMDSRAALAEADECRQELKNLNVGLSICAASVDAVENELNALTQQLQNVKIQGTATSAADGALVVMEGWAEEDKSQQVDKLLEEYSGVIYLKRNPTPEDDTPVKLKNNRFARLFELIGAMYALPKYGTMDLTPFFAPFYMLFFAICLNDAGYGAILLLAGIGLLMKGGASLKQASWLTIFCGGATCFPPAAFSQQTDRSWCVNTPNPSLREANPEACTPHCLLRFPSRIVFQYPAWNIHDNTSCVALSLFLVTLSHSITSVSWDPFPNNLLHSNSHPRL